jgi:hypothetical protein
MPDQFVTIATSQLVSSAFYLDRSYRGAAIHVPSYGTAARVVAQFSTTSGTGPWATLTRPEGSGLEWTIFSGTGSPAVGVVPFPPSPFARIALSSCQTDAVTFTVTVAGGRS